MIGLLTGGCMISQVPAGDPVVDSDEYSDWTTAHSRHFVLHTDAGVGATEAILTRFEDTYAGAERLVLSPGHGLAGRGAGVCR